MRAFYECLSQIWLDLVLKENSFVLPGAHSDRWLDVSGIYSEELEEGQSPDIRLGLEPSLPLFCFLLGAEASFGCSFWRAVRIFESARRNPAALCFVSINAHSISFLQKNNSPNKANQVS